MAGTIQLLAGPCRRGKGHALLDLCAERIRAGREDSFIFIVPSPQRAAQVHERLLAETRGGCFKPFVGTFNELIRGLYLMLGGRGAPISTAVRAVLIQEILASQPEQFPYLARDGGREPFPGLIARLCDLVADLKRNLIDPETFASRAEHLPDMPQQKAAELARLYRQYQELLLHHDLVDDDGVFWLLIERLESGESAGALAAFDLLLLDGIHDLTVAEWRVLEALLGVVDRTVAALDYWDEAGAIARATQGLHGALMRAGARSIAAAANGRWDLGSPPQPSGNADACAPAGGGEREAAMEEDLFALPSRLTRRWPCRGSLRVLRCRDRQHEVTAVASQIKRLARGGADPGRICVAVPDLAGYTQLVREVFARYGVPVDIAAGMPLAQAPACAAAMQVLRLAIDGYRRRDVVNCLRSPYLRFTPEGATSPLDPNEVDSLSRDASVVRGREEWERMLERFEAALQQQLADAADADGERGDASVRTRALERRLRRARSARPGIADLLGLLRRLEGSHSPEAFRTLLQEVLSRFDFHQQIVEGRQLGLSAAEVRRDTKAFDRFWRCVDSVVFSTRFSQRKRYSLAQLEDMLASALGETQFRPERPSRGVQVVGVRDTRALDVDHLFLAGMVEGEFPRVRGQDIFLSDEDQARLGMKMEPRSDDEDRYLFYQCLVRPSASVTLLWPALADDREALRSPFLDEVLRITDVDEEAPREPDAPQTRADLHARLGRALAAPHDQAPVHAREEVAGWVADQPRVAANVVRNMRIRDDRGPRAALSRFQGVVGPVLADRWPPDRALSVSQLEAYGRCPFAFFMERVLALAAAEEPSEDLSALDRGDVLHRILRRYYTERRVEGLGRLSPSDDLDEEKAKIKQIAEEALAEWPREGLFWDAERASIVGAADQPGLLDRFIETEAGDGTLCCPAFFEVAYGELHEAESVDDALALPALVLPRGREPQVALVGKIDRIDLAEGDKFLVIDYKTGSGPPGAAEVRDGVHFQTPVYIMAVQQGSPGQWEPVGGVYYHIRSLSDFGKKSPLLPKPMAPLYSGPDAKRPRALEQTEFDELLDTCEEWIVKYAGWIRAGQFPPMCHARNRACTAWCPYKDVCRVDPARMTNEAVVALLETAPTTW